MRNATRSSRRRLPLANRCLERGGKSFRSIHGRQSPGHGTGVCQVTPAAGAGRFRHRIATIQKMAIAVGIGVSRTGSVSPAIATRTVT